MGIHVGKMIGEVLKRRGMAKAEFGRRLSCARQNVYRILEAESIDTVMLEKICNVLECNLFAMIAEEIEKGEKKGEKGREG